MFVTKVLLFYLEICLFFMDGYGIVRALRAKKNMKNVILGGQIDLFSISATTSSS